MWRPPIHAPVLRTATPSRKRKRELLETRNSPIDISLLLAVTGRSIRSVAQTASPLTRTATSSEPILCQATSSGVRSEPNTVSAPFASSPYTIATKTVCTLHFISSASGLNYYQKERPTPEQLRDRERDPIATIMAFAINSGVQQFPDLTPVTSRNNVRTSAPRNKTIQSLTLFCKLQS